MIREQDLQLALLRASLGTTAQSDPSLSRLRFHLPSGPLRPLLPSLGTTSVKDLSISLSAPSEPTQFNDLLLGTPLVLNYGVAWPLDLFLHPSELQVYASLFSYVSAIRKTHTRIHTCWTSLSNSQRARRRWTGLGEGGTAEDLEVRKELLRCGWGVVREMNWFLETLLGYIMTDVVDVEFARMKSLLLSTTSAIPRQITGSSSVGQDGGKTRMAPTHSAHSISTTSASPSSNVANANAAAATATSGPASHLDFTTLRTIHTTYLERLLTGSLLSNFALTAIIRSILEICERFVAQVERWGGDILPALLLEGSLAVGGDRIGKMVEERRGVVSEINEVRTSFKLPISSRGSASRRLFIHLKMGQLICASLYLNMTRHYTRF